MTYKALAYSTQFDDGRVSGELKINGNSLIFFNKSIELIIEKEDISIEMGGTANRQIFLISNKTEYKFSTADASILKTDFFAGNSVLEKQRDAIHNTKSIAKVALYASVGLFVFGLASIFIFRRTLVKYAAKGIPHSIEKQLGKSYMAQFAITDKLDSTSIAYQELNQKIKLLTKGLDSEYNIKTYIIKSKEVNAFALPGGYLVFNSELLKKADSWEEVLGVASHEIAHVTEQHHARGVLSQVGVFTVLSLMLGDGSALTDLLFGAGASIEGLSYSRDFESEADTKGFEYLNRANVNPNGLRVFFGKLEKQNSIAKNIPEFLSTHPSNLNRINEIKKLESQSKNKTFISLGDYKTFKNKIVKQFAN